MELEKGGVSVIMVGDSTAIQHDSPGSENSFQQELLEMQVDDTEQRTSLNEENPAPPGTEI